MVARAWLKCHPHDTPPALPQVMVAYFAMRRQFGQCMQEWNYGMAMMDVVSFGTFSFQPIILTKQ